ncbi:trypsin-like peptidase domain-containing protein [Nostoc muscorum FACHB-395]|nr:trypsin-like peptidase domain-containing protein [Desmonostoc muscorum FACHB-395]
MTLNNRLAVGVIGVAIAFIQPEVALTLTSEDVTNIAKDITVIISGPEIGSGTIIHRDGNTYTVLTNEHVIHGKGSYTVQTRDKNIHQVNSNQIKRLPDVDLAVLEFTSSQKYTIATVGNSDAAKEGATVYVSGAPVGLQGIEKGTVLVPKGEIVGKNSDTAKEGYSLIYSNTTSPGMSGGPVLDENGRLIGIHGRGARDNNNQKAGLNLGIPIKIFTASAVGSSLGLITQNTPTKTTPRPTPTSQPSNPPIVGRPTTINGSGGAVESDVCAGRRC